MKGWPKEALEALTKEVYGLVQRGVWTGVHRSELTKEQRKRLIRSSTRMNQKYDLISKVEKWKARVVSDGSMQDRTLYKPEDTKSPTAQLSSILTFAAIAAAKNFKIKTMDIAQAYLNADMPHDVFISLEPKVAEVLMSISPDFTKFKESDGRIIVKLNKAQYGCIESAKLWYDTFSDFLLSIGFVANPYDPCVFTRINPDGSRTYAAIYVDDILAIGENQSELDRFQSELEAKFGKMSVTDGDHHSYLGMVLDFSDPGKCKVTMKKYIDEIVEAAGINTIAETPASEKLFEISENSPLLDEQDRERFHKVVAQLLYAAIRARPDILLPIIFLTSRVTKATKEDDTKLRRILRYLKGTAELGIILGADDTGNLRLFTYADASYGVHPDGKSHGGVYVSLGRGPIKVKTAVQKLNVISSTEAEIVTLTSGSSTTAFMTNFLDSLGIKLEPAVIYQDNLSTMALAFNGRSNSDRTRHIKLRYFFIKQYLDSGEFVLLHCPTDLMIADILTKPLQGANFLRLRDLLLGITTH
jgi:histone deacetylase 1/2